MDAFFSGRKVVGGQDQQLELALRVSAVVVALACCTRVATLVDPTSLAHVLANGARVEHRVQTFALQPGQQADTVGELLNLMKNC